VLGTTLLLCLTAMLAVAPAALSAPSSDPYVVVLRDDVAHPANVAHRHEENRGARVGHIYGVAIKGYSAGLTRGQVAAIRQDPNVDYVERDGPVHPDSQLTGTQVKRVYANQNPQLDIDEADDARVNVDIAILDTGVFSSPVPTVGSRSSPTTGPGQRAMTSRGRWKRGRASARSACLAERPPGCLKVPGPTALGPVLVPTGGGPESQSVSRRAWPESLPRRSAWM
jgi:hypothetical protein